MASKKLKVAALSASNGIAKIIGIAVMMLMTRVLTKDDVAAYRQTLLAYAAIVPLLSMGIGQGMYYFLPAEKIRIRGRVVDGIVVTSFMGVLFSIALALGGNELLAQRFSNPKVANMLLWMIPYAIINTPGQLFSSVLVARDHVSVAAIFGIIKQLAVGIATAIPILLWQTAESALIGNVAASLLMGIASISLMLRTTPHDSFAPSLVGIKELVWFTLPLSLGTMFATISMQLDKLIVSFLCPPEEFAVYVLGAMEVPFIGIVTGAITSVVLADMRKSIVENRPDEALRLFRQIAEKSSLIMLPAMMFLMLTADTLMQAMYTSDYAASAIPFRIYLLLLPIRTIVFGSMILALGMSRFIMFRSLVGLVVNAALSVVLVWSFGAWGAAGATVATVCFWGLPANVYMVRRELKINWHAVLPFSEIGKVFLAISPLVAVSMLAMAGISNKHWELGIITLFFTSYMLVFWDGRLYSFRRILNSLFHHNHSQ